MSTNERDQGIHNHRATQREWMGLLVMCIPCLMYSIDRTVLNLVVPSISVDLLPSATQLLWIVDIYGFFLAGLLLTMGFLGDSFGRRRILFFGAAAFGATSIFAAYSQSSAMLIAARALMGISAAALAPSTLSLLRHMFVDPRQRSLAIGIWATSYSVGAAIGPVIGGFLLQNHHWGSVFMINVPVMAILLLIGPLTLPEFRHLSSKPLDIMSVILSITSVLLIVYGIKQFAASGWQTQSLAAIALGLPLAFAFVRRQHTFADALIDPTLFRAVTFRVPWLIYTGGCFVTLGTSLLVAQYFQLVLDLPPLTAGLWLLPASFGTLAGSMTAPILGRRLSNRSVMITGLTMAAVGLVLMIRIEHTPEFSLIASGLFLLHCGLALTFIRALDLMVCITPLHRAGTASAVAETGCELGAALGVAVLGSIANMAYRTKIADALPAGLGAEAAEQARTSLGGAIGAAQQLTHNAAEHLVHIAEEAFRTGFRSAILWSLVIVLLMLTSVSVSARSSRSSVDFSKR